MKVSFRSMKTDRWTKALYAIEVDGNQVGAVGHQKVQKWTRHTRMPREGAMVTYGRRSKPLLWVARGSSGRRQIRTEAWTRQAAVKDLLEQLGFTPGD